LLAAKGEPMLSRDVGGLRMGPKR